MQEPILFRCLRVVILSLPVLLVLCVTVVLFAVLQSQLTGTPIFDDRSLLIGVIFALSVWLIVAAFHIKRESITVAVHNRHDFLAAVTKNLTQLGYVEGPAKGDVLVFVPPFRSMLLGGSMKIQTTRDLGHVEGPKVYLDWLRRQLRTQLQIDAVHRMFEQTKPGGDVYVNRVHITARVLPLQWQGLYQALIDPLAKSGAEVVCDVDILAQGIKDMSDEKLVKLLQDYQQQSGLNVEMRQT